MPRGEAGALCAPNLALAGRPTKPPPATGCERGVREECGCAWTGCGECVECGMVSLPACGAGGGCPRISWTCKRRFDDERGGEAELSGDEGARTISCHTTSWKARGETLILRCTRGERIRSEKALVSMGSARSFRMCCIDSIARSWSRKS